MNSHICILLAAVLAVNSTSIGTKVKNDMQFIVKKTVEKLDWWENTVFYEIYTRSFKDSNGDGIGDLQGVIQKLDYLHDTGIRAACLSPIFKSPQQDQGYDISDYLDIDPIFGTLDDLKELLEKAHDLGIKIILDFIPNHTSDQHVWFQLSENGTEGYEDFYVWHDGEKDADGEKQVPNNWISVYGGSAWEWSEVREQYYLHQFSKFEPDLNYENPLVSEAMTEIVTFWLDFGVDGFKVDAVPYIYEDIYFRDEPLVSGQDEYDVSNYSSLNHTYTRDQNETFNLVYVFRAFLDNFTESNEVETKLLLLDTDSPLETQVLYYVSDYSGLPGAHISLNFNLITTLPKNFTLQDLILSLYEYTQEIFFNGYESNWVLGNSDNHRAATHWGQENVDIFNMMIAMLPGAMITYNGEEIGMEDGEVTCEQGQDPLATDCSTFDKVSRDFERTPFQWDNSTNGGFTNGTPWLPVSEKASEVNLDDQNLKGADSHYNLYKELLNFRKIFHNYTSFYSTGSAVMSENIFRVEANAEQGQFRLFFNIGNEEDTVDLEESSKFDHEVLIVSVGSTFSPGDALSDELTLQPHESIICQLTEIENLQN